MDDTLVDALAGAGQEMHTSRLGDGSEVLLLPHGGRVLGLFAAGDSRNFLWTNPLLRSAETAKAMLSSQEWHNTGGDRTWLAPEIDFFLPHFPDTSVYHQPRALDPGDFHFEIADGIPTFAMEFSITPLGQEEPLKLRLSKSVHTTRDPLRDMANGDEIDGIQFAGYSLKTVLEFLDNSPTSRPVGLWSLLQMPHGGEIVLPTCGPAEVCAWFGEVPPRDLRIEQSAVHYFTRANGAQKLGLRAAFSTGRGGYYYEVQGIGHLIVRNFSLDLSGDYIDAPWTDPGDTGYAVQVCNVNNELGQFSELEYHVPAIGGGTGKSRSEDCSQVWAYRGIPSQLAAVAERLLGSSFGDLASSTRQMP